MDSEQSWKEEFKAIIASLDNTIAEAKRVSDKEQRKQLLQQAESDEYTAKTILDRVQNEIRTLDYDQKRKATKELSNFRLQLERRSTDLHHVRQKQTTIDIPEGKSGRENEGSKEQRKRLLGTQAVVEDTSRALDNTIQQIDQAVDIGTDTTTQLSSQGDQIKASLLGVRETDSILERSRKTLERMRQRVITNKLILYLIILIELGIIGLIVFLKYFN